MENIIVFNILKTKNYFWHYDKAISFIDFKHKIMN